MPTFLRQPRLLATSATAVTLMLTGAACGRGTLTTPDGPSLELQNPVTRLSPTDAFVTINAHVYGSFSIQTTGTGPGTVITSGPANFPGHASDGPGTCVDGRWYNSQGKATSGSLARPHPHCIQPAAAVEIQLEPITACFDNAFMDYGDQVNPFGNCASKQALRSGEQRVSLIVSRDYDGQGTPAEVEGSDFYTSSGVKGVPPMLDSSKTVGGPVVSAYAIDVQSGKRVGVLTIDLSQYNSGTVDQFDKACTVTATQVSPCLLPVIQAAYTPFTVGGEGQAAASVPGFLWFTPASQPYDYTP